MSPSRIGILLIDFLVSSNHSVNLRTNKNQLRNNQLKFQLKIR